MARVVLFSLIAALKIQFACTFFYALTASSKDYKKQDSRRTYFQNIVSAKEASNKELKRTIKGKKETRATISLPKSILKMIKYLPVTKDYESDWKTNIAGTCKGKRWQGELCI